MIVHQFSDCEALRIAAQIERKGERFYRMAAGVAKNGPAEKLLEMLRQQELGHAIRFEKMEEKIGCMKTDPYDVEANAFLSAIAAEIVFPGGVLASLMNKKLETVRDILMHAIASEKDSLLFYYEMLTETQDEECANILREIIAEEKAHLCDLQELLENTK